MIDSKVVKFTQKMQMISGFQCEKSIVVSLTYFLFGVVFPTGVERSPDEMEDGQADVASTVFSPYSTGMLQYTEKNFNKLVNLTNYNILNNEPMILKALRIAVERKKKQKRGNFF